MPLIGHVRVTSFGAGPRYFLELSKHNINPSRAITYLVQRCYMLTYCWAERHANKLHTILSTGAVMTPSLATWISESFGPVCQISFSGGTELCGSFVHGTRSLPSYPGEIAVKALGMDVIALSPANGAPLPDGESGELVCRKPFPNMPVAFLNDPDKRKYRSAYFESFPRTC